MEVQVKFYGVGIRFLPMGFGYHNLNLERGQKGVTGNNVQTGW